MDCAQHWWHNPILGTGKHIAGRGKDGTVQIAKQKESNQEGHRVGETAKSFFRKFLLIWEKGIFVNWEKSAPRIYDSNSVGLKKFLGADHSEIGNVHEQIDSGRNGNAAKGRNGQNPTGIFHFLRCKVQNVPTWGRRKMME
jgi:hypothetical protein